MLILTKCVVANSKNILMNFLLENVRKGNRFILLGIWPDVNSSYT